MVDDRSRRWGAIAAASLAVVAVVLVTGCSRGADRSSSGRPAATHAPSDDRPGSDDPTTTAPSRPRVESLAADDPGFYDVPDPIPAGHHGDLIRTQPVAGAPTGSRWLRIMYLSETVTGKPTVVTGVLTVPDASPPPGGWPLFAHAHGSTGLATDCAPSMDLGGRGTRSIEISLLSTWVPTKRIAVVSTDYEGLGGPGHHPFLVGVSEGRSVLDSILAARQVPGTAYRDRVGIIGYSQGGHAALWADQIAPEWTPDLDVAGVLAGAPASELMHLVEVQGDGAAVMLVGGLAAADPRLDPATALTTAGLRVLGDLQRSCDATGASAGDGPLTKVDVRTTEPWADAIRANEPGASSGAAPVLIVHSKEDERVPVTDSEALQERLCSVGVTVERRVLDHGNHVATAVPAYEQGIDWILALEGGAAPTSTCR